MKAISYSPVNAPGVCLLPPQKPQDGISEGGRGGLPEHLPQVKTMRISKTK